MNDLKNELKLLKKKFREHLSHIEIVDSEADFTKAVPMTSSLCVAQIFEKRHNNVMAKIRQVIEDSSEEFRLLNFKQSSYQSQELNNGVIKEQPCYLMTKDGFTMVVMSFTGRKAAAFKEAYIEEFNRRGRELMKIRMERIKTKETRRTLTDSLKENLDTECPFIYSNYSKLAFKIAVGKSMEQFRRDSHLSKTDNVRNYLNEEQLNRLIKIEKKVSSLVEVYKLEGRTDAEIYQRTKDVLTRVFLQAA